MYAWVLVITCCSCKCPNKWTLPHTFPNTKTQVRAHSCLKRSQGLHRHHVLTPLQKVHPILVWKSINTNTTLLNVVLSTLPTCENSSCESFARDFISSFFPIFHTQLRTFILLVFLLKRRVNSSFGHCSFWSQLSQRVYDLYTSYFMSFM